MLGGINMETKNYFLRHHKSSNSGFGEGIENHKFWLMRGDKEPGSIDEYDSKGKNFRYCHVGEKDEDILFDVTCDKVLTKGMKPHFQDYDRTKAFLLSVCKFLNSGEILKDTKGYYYISEFCFGRDDFEKASYQIDFIRSDEERSNQTRKDSGGFINKATGDVALFDMFCVGQKMKTKRKKLMQQICNACNQGVIMF